jgi:hypothetical protein
VKTAASFKKLSRSDDLLYGPRKILLCGFSSSEQDSFTSLIHQAGLRDAPLVWVAADRADMLVSDLLRLPDRTGLGEVSTLPRAVILSGATENEIHRLMALNRKTSRQATIWATVTPVSETWTLKNLLRELQAERKAFGRKKK